MRTRLFAVVLFAIVAAAVPVWADDVGLCGVGSLADYIGLGESGCSLGLFTLKNFNFDAFDVTGGLNPLAAEDIMVSPDESASALFVSFSADFFAGEGQSVKYSIGYLIDPPPVIIRFEESMDTFTPVAPGFATIDTTLCVGGSFPCRGELLMLSLFHRGDDSTAKLNDGVDFKPTDILGVAHLIALDGGPAGGGGSADFRALHNTAHIVPEPAMIIPLAGGIAALLLLRRRRVR
jgi:hypothetical protein